MKIYRWKLLTLFIILPLLANGVDWSQGESPEWPYVDTNNDEFALKIANNGRAIYVNEYAQPFYVVLQNVSKEPKRIFEYWNSWGYQNLSFYLSFSEEGSNHALVISRLDQDFTRNFPSYLTLAPGEEVVFPITFNEQWSGLDHIPDGTSKVTLQAVYKTDPTFQSKANDIWVGIVASKALQVLLVNNGSDSKVENTMKLED